MAAASLLAATVVVAELGLQVASRTSRSVERLLAAPWERNAPVVADDRLIHRGSPLSSGHDEGGYRNERRLARADVVVLGDSMTYGPLDPARAWPRVLASDTGRAVYSMALPGYGPAQSLFQLEAALALRPAVVVVAPYFGNDLFDSFMMARRHPTLLAALPETLVRDSESLERRRELRHGIASPFQLGVDGTEQQIGGVRRWVSTHVMLFKLARALRHRMTAVARPDPLLSRDFEIAAAAVGPALQASLSPFEGGAGWRTILSGRYRLPAIDDNDPRVRVGFLVMCDALEQIAARTRAAGTRLLVVLFPTKESVFWPLVSDPDRHPGLREVVTNETRLRAELVGRLRRHDVDVLDLLPVLRGAGEQPYYQDVDGHPNEVGYRLVAAAVAARLGSPGR